MKSPRLSIVTVVRNSLPPLKKTILSLQSQQEKIFEYIIIDGESTDETKNFVLSKPTPADVVISESDTGIYAAMNKAPALCHGDYIQYLNAGDQLCSSGTLKAILPYLDKKSDIVIFNYRINGKQYHPKLDLINLIGGTPCHQAIFYRRDYLIKNPFDTNFKYCADFHHLLNALSTQTIRIADPLVIDYDITGISSQPQARRRIRMERALSAWKSTLKPSWRLIIMIYNILRIIR